VDKTKTDIESRRSRHLRRTRLAGAILIGDLERRAVARAEQRRAKRKAAKRAARSRARRRSTR